MSTTPPRQERRSHPRSQLGHYLPVSVPEWSQFAVWGSDLSRGGVGLKTDNRVRLGDRFVLGVPGIEAPVEAEVCNVVWVDTEQRYAVGLRWLPRDDATRAQLEQFCQRAVRCPE